MASPRLSGILGRMAEGKTEALIARADAAADAAHALRVHRRALKAHAYLARERLHEEMLESALERERARQVRAASDNSN